TRHDRIHRGRYHRSWTDDEGAFCYRGRTTPEQGELIKRAVDATADEVFRKARSEHRNEPAEAYAIDALATNSERAAEGLSATSRPRWTAQVRIDFAALRRGHTTEGEVCEIPGIGPIPVATSHSSERQASAVGCHRIHTENHHVKPSAESRHTSLDELAK